MSRIVASSSPTASTRFVRCCDGAMIDETRHLDRLDALARANLRIAMPVADGGLEGHPARDDPAQPRARRHGLSAGDARRRPKRDFVFPAADTPSSLIVIARSIDRAKAEARAGRRHCGDHPAGQSLGAGRHQVRLAPAQCLGAPGGARAGRARGLVRRCGRLWSRKALPAMPGSSRKEGTLVTRPAERGILRGVTRTTCSIWRGETGIAVAERPFTRRGGQGGAGGLRHGGDHADHAGGEDRRYARRRWQAGAACDLRCGAHFHAHGRERRRD